MSRNQVTYANLGRDGHGGEFWTCRQTGLRYSVERASGAYFVFRQNDDLGVRPTRDAALRLLDQNARLDFLTAQAASAFA